MKVNINDVELKIVGIPKRYTSQEGVTYDGYHIRTDLHYDHGFRDVVMPDYDASTHVLGDLIMVDDTVTYEISLKPPVTEEQEAQLLANQRDQAVSGGILIDVGEKQIHFNMEKLNNFITQKNEIGAAGVASIFWLSTDGDMIPLTIDEATAIGLQALQTFQELYL